MTLKGKNTSRGSLIVMEGIDGTGKTTQCRRMIDKLESEGQPVVYKHFPSYNTYHGEPVEHFLRGEFGDAGNDSPYFVHSLYAIDRAIVWRTTLKELYEKGHTILLDRYTTSSMIFQADQFSSDDEKKRFIDYVYDFEYNKMGIQEPDKVIFLHIPFELSVELKNKRLENDGIKDDVFERDLEFLSRAYRTSIFVADYLSWEVIECAKDGKLLAVDEIHEKIYKLMPKKNI